jgi:hypothetical protein
MLNAQMGPMTGAERQQMQGVGGGVPPEVLQMLQQRAGGMPQQGMMGAMGGNIGGGLTPEILNRLQQMLGRYGGGALGLK